MLELLLSILSIYLALTNALAERIETFLPSENRANETTSLEQEKSSSSETETLEDVASEYGGNLLPDILIRNAAYQQASLIEATDETTGNYANSLTDALVNIYCTFTTATHIRTITGTGFFVANTGVILTNAHVAQFLLLDGLEEGTTTSCSVRTGQDLEPTYAVDLLYVPPSWIRKHASLIDDPNPRGSGERDFALLYVTRMLAGDHETINTPYLPVDTDLLSADARDRVVTIGGYPTSAGSAEPEQRHATTTIADLFTFTSSYADIMYLRGSGIGEHGISGGPVVDPEGNVIGLISTKGNDAKLGAGSLHAITLSYIDRTIEEETGFGFIQSTKGDLPYRAKLFRKTLVPFLKQFLAAELEN